MNKNFDIILLDNKTKLLEIHNLRVIAWKFSKNTDLINDEMFLKMLNNDIEKDLVFYVEDNKNIIATVRIRILQETSSLNKIYLNYSLPSEKPFGLYERLVVHPDYRGNGIVQAFDEYILKFAIRHNIKFLLTEAIPPRDKLINKLGWKTIGTVNIDGFNNPQNTFEVVSMIHNLNE